MGRRGIEPKLHGLGTEVEVAAGMSRMLLLFATGLACNNVEGDHLAAAIAVEPGEDGTSSGSDDVATDGKLTEVDVGGPDIELGPCDAVDLLFVVDNSGSMADEQRNLVASFPGFIAGIESTLGVDTDYHVGVITTDDSAHNGVGCRKLGALVTRTGGAESSDAACGPYTDGRRYMTPFDRLDDSFACAAKVGIDGDGIERPMDAVGAALSPAAEGLSLCNEGYLRGGALLVLTIITDEEDDIESQGDPSDWYDAVVAAKGGDASRVVVLSLVGHAKPNACIPEQWTGADGAEIATRIIALTEMFEHGRVGDVCSADYGTFFRDAVQSIARACYVVVPVG